MLLPAIWIASWLAVRAELPISKALVRLMRVPSLVRQVDAAGLQRGGAGGADAAPGAVEAGLRKGAGGLLDQAVHVGQERLRRAAEDAVLVLEAQEHLAQASGNAEDAAPGGFRESSGDGGDGGDRGAGLGGRDGRGEGSALGFERGDASGEDRLLTDAGLNAHGVEIGRASW